MSVRRASYNQRRSQVPVSSIPRTLCFNERVQADTMWLKVSSKQRALPILMITDASTRYTAGRLLPAEKPKEFIQALERGWLRTFGPMKLLQVDDHRAWASQDVRDWCSEQGIELQISPGQSHTRLSILERRHQVTRRALENFLADQKEAQQHEPPRDQVIRALCYVLPQINRSTNVHGYSPVQWVLGYTPQIPGLLLEEPMVPPTLDATEEFMTKLHRQKAAANAVFAADLDQRLTRALLRKFTGQVSQFALTTTVMHLAELDPSSDGVDQLASS